MEAYGDHVIADLQKRNVHPDSIHAVVDGLKRNGVVFEEYDLPGMKTEDGVATMGDTRAAWLKDQDGNILEIVGA